MPSLPFVLPHWMYWFGLVLVPLFGLFMVRREQHKGPPGNASFPIAYLLWLCGGLVGLHRFYLGSKLGLVYAPLLLAILIGNVQSSEIRLAMSEAQQDVTKAEFLLKRAAKRQGEDSQAAQEARQDAAAARQRAQVARERRATVETVISGFAIVLAILLLIDAALIPRLVHQYREQHGRAPPAVTEGGGRTEVHPTPPRPRTLPGAIVWTIDRISGWTGHFLAFWSIIAVFVYYYEVVARYVFNSPTNWAHESMFLMFGMLYMLSGAFALREGSHVRVDVVYQYLPSRAQAVTDIVTSVFFFIFVIAILVTGWTFAMDAIQMGEVSFTEWAIQYWPIKLMIPIGAALILLQGIAELMRSIAVLTDWYMPPKRASDNAVETAA